MLRILDVHQILDVHLVRLGHRILVGHLDRLQRIESLLQQLPGLTLAGNGYRGIGVPDCVRSGSEAADKTLLALGLREVAPQVLTS